MSLKQSEYFARLASVPEIGTAGLERLQSSNVVVVGVGGVGYAAAGYLARSGIGNLRLIDQDIVEPSNLHRLPGVSEERLYHAKAEVAAEILSKSNPRLRIEPIVDTIRADNSEKMLDGADLVVDGLDNFRTRYILNEYSYRTQTPYLFASAIANQGHVSLFAPPRTPCLSCTMPNVVDRPQDSCETLGVTPSAVGFVGAILASEAVKCLLCHGTRLDGHLLTVDLAGPEFMVTEIRRRETCDVCGKRPTRKQAGRKALTWLCGENTANVVPSGMLNLALREISRKLPIETILASTDTVLVFRRGPHTVSLFQTGRVLVEGVQDEEGALKTATEIWQQFLPSPAFLPEKTSPID